MNIETLRWAIVAIVSVTTITALPAAHAQGSGRAVVVTNGPQTNPGDVSRTWSPRRNVIDSQNYDQLPTPAALQASIRTSRPAVKAPSGAEPSGTHGREFLAWCPGPVF